MAVRSPVAVAAPTSPAPPHDGPVDPDRLQAFTARWAADQAATAHAATVVVGDLLGLWTALADGGPQTPDALAAATGCQQRLLREWLSAQVASGYCAHDPASGRFWLSPEQAACLADPDSPTFLAGGAMAMSSLHKGTALVAEAMAGDGGVGWHEHHPDLFTATRRFFTPVYRAHLVASWIPAMEGVVDRLAAGGRVLDVGCGHGSALLLLARAWPTTSLVGLDAHDGSVAVAREAAVRAGVADRMTVTTDAAAAFDAGGYDLVCLFNALHELGDPVGVARAVRGALAPGGAVLLTEPRADDALGEGVRARTFYSVSTMVCTPSGLAQGDPDPLGAQAGEGAVRAVLHRAGLSRVRRIAETPTFMVLQAQP